MLANEISGNMSEEGTDLVSIINEAKDNIGKRNSKLDKPKRDSNGECEKLRLRSNFK